MHDTSETGAYRIEIVDGWAGRPVRPARRTRLDVTLDDRELVVEVDAPFHGDEPPAAAPGRLDGLWQHEVVELFLVADDRRYLELELGPHGHWLALLLAPVRRRLPERPQVRFACRIENRRWRGRARVAAAHVPRPLARWNAFAIHGGEGSRRYLAAAPVPGVEPDFHRIDLFPPWPPLSAPRDSRRSPPRR